ncbi:Protein farnesyltransferase subunit beta [Spironucleus salmonicida]|uniref:Geranylgeranyl transferase type II subunit beta n=1 Tax=Spironucleus salmonicida TaxID=348837 RepID=V6LLD5_9EUKA|nr:Protein farnesyltransferase subunit beta [Spironucleus salmonicida]|eukprot:EST44556.1 Prenyltransferase and squalene oxidase repeat protein [Spironucleus salmonicida]
MNLTETEKEQLEVFEEVQNALNIFKDAEMDFTGALQFLITSLQLLHRKEEGTRVSQLYWAVSPILILQKLLKTDIKFNFVHILADSLSVFFPGQEPHAICVYGASLLRYAMNLQLTNEQTNQIVKFVHTLKRKSGGFGASETGETDTRTTYAVLTIIYLNNIQEEFSDFLGLTVIFLKKKLQNFGFAGQEDFGEAHASFTYCALTGLEILKRLGYFNEFTRQEERRLLKFLVFRQQITGGFNGRTNKHEDGCYNFWVGASLCILKKQSLVNMELFNIWVKCCNQDFETGGFRDKPGISSDRFHNCYVLTGWCLLNGVCSIDPALPVYKEVCE